MLIQYVHTFVFACTHCQLPVAITRVSGEQSPQSCGNRPMRTSCGYCGKVCYGLAATAKHHYAEDWQRVNEAGHQ